MRAGLFPAHVPGSPWSPAALRLQVIFLPGPAGRVAFVQSLAISEGEDSSEQRGPLVTGEGGAQHTFQQQQQQQQCGFPRTRLREWEKHSLPHRGTW